MTSKQTLTQTMLEDSLRELGVTENMQLEVHSSLSSFGQVEGGAFNGYIRTDECGHGKWFYCNAVF